jgi:hypothetical protein
MPGDRVTVLPAKQVQRGVMLRPAIMLELAKRAQKLHVLPPQPAG